jgi:glycosyltransferase involved in cell wall biosynthesis
MTRVSIITPFLNAGPFIEESIKSVLAQTYDNWELLLLDDGSTDASTGIALKYAAAHADKVRYLSHERRQNRGASASRNLAARHARGEYLAFLDADDVYLPRKLEVQVPILDAHPDVAMLYAATEYWYSWSGRREDAGRDWVWRRYGAKPDTVIEPPRMLVRFLEDGGTVPCMGGVLVRRAAVESVGGWEESFRRICTDQVFHAKLCLNFPVMIVDVCLDRYRQHENSACQMVERAGQADAALETYLTWLESYVAAQPIVDPTVRAAARRALRRYRHPWLYRVQRQALSYDARLRRLASRTIGRTLPRPLRQRLRGRER